MAPGQVWTIETDMESKNKPSGWMLLIHPDFLWNTPLAKTIKQYPYFGYSVFEALYLSEKEEKIMGGIVDSIEQEYQANLDKFSQNVIIAQLELLLTYSDRFYQRQFLTRKKSSHQILERLEEVLSGSFTEESLAKHGIPTVGFIAGVLNLSPGYLSELVKSLTGQNTQQLIHEKLIEKAKEQLSTTGLSVSEIAYALGFEHIQSFSKLFKAKTAMSPIEFRQNFN